MHPIKTIYNFIVTIQIFTLIIFLFYLVESNFDLEIPLKIGFTIPLDSPYDDVVIDFEYTIHFTIASLFFLIATMFLVFVLSSINVVGIGLTDSGSISIKQIISFLAKYFLLITPLLYLLSLSSVLYSYTMIISILILIIYVLNLFIDIGDESNVN